MSTGKSASIDGVKIAGVVSCCPPNRITNSFFEDRFSIEDIKSIEKMSGVEERYWASDETGSDLCVVAGRNLLEGIKWNAEDVDAVIYVSQSPDYLLPATSIKIARALQVPSGCIAFDINLGCSGYPYGLFLAMNLIKSGAAKKVLLAVAEIASKIIDKNDRSTAMIFGDCGTVTAIEETSDYLNNKSSFIMGSDADGQKNLIVPASRFLKNEFLLDERMVDKNPEYIFMDGVEVFNFTLKRVPDLVKTSLENTEKKLDYYLFHQANKFMLSHLIKKLKIPASIAPMNIDRYGNTSCASIPLLITTDLKNAINSSLDDVVVGMYGFGVGYSWSSCILNINPKTYIANVEMAEQR